MTTSANASPVHFEGSVADIARDWSMTIRPAPPGPPRRIDGYTIGAIPNIDGPGPHSGEVHPDLILVEGDRTNSFERWAPPRSSTREFHNP